MSGTPLCCLLVACVWISSTAGVQHNGGSASSTLNNSQRPRFTIIYKDEFCEKFRCQQRVCVRKFQVNFINIGGLDLVVAPLNMVRRYFPETECLPVSKKSILEPDSRHVTVGKRWFWWRYCWK